MRVIIVDRDHPFILGFTDLLKEQMKELHMQLDRDVEIIRSTDEFSFDCLQEGGDLCVITEVLPPEIDGLALAAKIREVDEKTAIVICTETNDYGMQCYDLGITYYLLKPVTEQSVRAMLKRVQRKMMEECS